MLTSAICAACGPSNRLTAKTSFRSAIPVNKKPTAEERTRKDTHMATNTKKTTTEKNTFDVWALEADALFAEWGTVQTVNAQNVGHWPIKRQPTQKRGK